MLEALVAFAERKQLLEDTSFAKRVVHYRLRLSGEGELRGLEPLGDEDRGLELSVPTPPKRSVGITPAFLVDNAQYVLGVPKRKKGAEPEENALHRAPQCLDAFLGLVKEAVTATGAPALLAVQTFLQRVVADDSVRATVMQKAPGHEWIGDEAIVFVVDGETGGDVHELPAVRAYWSAKRSESSVDGSPRRCLVTGAMSVPARLHDSIKRIPEAQSSGASLVSFNAAAFTSHGLEQGANAPVSQRAADGYVRALNFMLEKEGERRFRCGVPVGSDAVMVFWSRTDDSFADVLQTLFDPPGGDEEEMRAVLESAWKGLAPSRVDDSLFYALTLSGNASRVVVREWLEASARDVKANVLQYFNDLALDSDPAPLPVGRLLRALEATPSASGDKHGLSAPLASRLFRAALQGTPIPLEVLRAALTRLRVPPKEAEWRGTLRARVALIKASLIRMHPGRRQEVAVSLDPNNDSLPYLLGRLFAAVERLQGAALGDVNASIRDRYFGAASTTPGLVFPRLLRMSVHHANKAERDGHGWPDRVKAEIVDRLPAVSPFPSTLSLEGQGLFAVGYYHQRQAFFTKREKKGDEPTT